MPAAQRRTRSAGPMAAILDPPTRTRQMQVGIASCGKVSGSALKTSTFVWTHLHMPEADAKMATQASVEAELARRSASWSPELRSKYDRYTKDARATLAYGPVYNGKPPPRWHSDRMMLIGDAAHPYGPGGQGISMALKDAKALGELISRGFTEEGRREFQRSRAQESRALGEAAEKRNARGESSTRWGVLAQGVLMKAVEIVTRGKLRF
jgi:2-polyprenyl-6-methoxyphenol hydroxylase-like FAD-dependent oxidoreductase